MSDERQAIDLLRAVGRRQSFSARQTILHKGDEAGSLMIVEEGVVRISVSGIDGREMALALCGPGEIIGEIAVLDRGERTADAVAVRGVSATIISGSELRRLMYEEPLVLDHMVSLLCRRLRSANRHAEGHALGSLTGRLAVQLLNLTDHGAQNAEGRHVIDAVPSQSELARLVGGARESVNRQLKKWQQEALIQFDGSRMVIEDAEALQISSV